MIQAIGSAPGPTSLPGTGGGGLQAQLSQAERQLADCITCDTADTPSGKAKIQVLTARVQALKERLEEVENSKRAQPVPSFADATAGVSPPSFLGGGLDVTA